jgi:ATP-dependent DNA helicase RecG
LCDFIAQEYSITRKEIAKILGVSEKTIERHIKAMHNIEYVGKGYSGHWTIKE